MTIQRKNVFAADRPAAVPATMAAIRYRRYGGPEVLEYGIVPTPRPGDDEVLVAVRAASVNPYEWHWMRGEPYLMRPQSGWRAPRDPRLGVDLAGVVVAAGAAVTEFRPGDAVFGIGSGALAEYAVARAADLARLPDGVAPDHAAAVPLAALTALQGLRDTARLRRGMRVLVVGASGGVGTFAVQLARVLGADVDAVTSTRNVELVRGLGASGVIDYTREDPTGGDPDRYDVILDIAGGAAGCLRRVLRPGGTIALVGGPGGGRLLGPAARIFRTALRGRFSRDRVAIVQVSWRGDDLRYLAELLAAGRLLPVIDRRYPLAETAHAIAYLEEGHARGKVVIAP